MGHNLTTSACSHEAASSLGPSWCLTWLNCSTIQIQFFGISIVWLAMSLALLLVYFDVQNNQIYPNRLTSS